MGEQQLPQQLPKNDPNAAGAARDRKISIAAFDAKCKALESMRRHAEADDDQVALGLIKSLGDSQVLHISSAIGETAEHALIPGMDRGQVIEDLGALVELLGRLS